MNNPAADATSSRERQYSLIDEGLPLKAISDTAFWAAAYRATENELFRDPYAQRLAGRRGDLIAAALPEATKHAWVIVVRTHLIDRYIVDLVNATRHPDKYGEPVSKWIQIGSSPRGGISLDRASRVNAWLEGRDHVTPDDVRAVVHPVLRHRLILSYDANADGVSADQVIDKLVELVAVPA